jgi:5-methylcytosine-specific restriction enzyme subunit McrC
VRSAYASRQDNLFALRGKRLMAPHLRQNLSAAGSR